MWDKQIKAYVYVALILSLTLYIYISYFVARADTLSLLCGYGVLFALYIYLYRFVPGYLVDVCLGIAVVLRFSLILAIPNLSDDIYRFLWDGRLVLQGYDPFNALPSSYVSENATVIEGITPELYEKLNSKNYFTIYPPFAQLVFLLSAWASPTSILGSVITMKAIIILAETGSILLIRKLLRVYKLPNKRALLYALNPLVIIEFAGNVHFEAFMICFCLLAFYWSKKGNPITSGIAYALAICAKLLPLMVLPLLLRRLKLKRALIMYGIIGLVTLALFLPLLSTSLFEGMSASIKLYFQKFEFNASIYYLIREIGFAIKGYNIIQTSGVFMGIAAMVMILGYTLWEALRAPVKLPQAAMWVFFIYLLMATTVHPWYITTLLAFSVFTKYHFGIYWTFLVFLSYAGYTQGGFSEVYWLTTLEYVIVFGYLAYEIYYHHFAKRKTWVTDSPV